MMSLPHIMQLLSRWTTIGVVEPIRPLLGATRARPQSPRQVLFSVNLANHYPLYEPMLRVLADDDAIEVYFADPAHVASAPFELLAPFGVPKDRILSGWQAGLRRWDLTVECSYATINPMLPRIRRRAQTFHGAAFKFLLDGRDITLHQRLRTYDLVMCLSEQHLETLRSGGVLKSEEAGVCVGYPKLDALAQGHHDRAQTLREYGADPERVSVLYAPSWNPELSLHQIGAELIDQLSEGDHTLLVKPHPMSLPLPDSLRPMPAEIVGRRWDRFLEERHREGRIVYVRDPITARYLGAADILVTDHGSTPFEYMCVGRPLLFFDTPGARGNMSDPQALELLLQATHAYGTAQEAVAKVAEIIAAGCQDAPDRQEAQRQLVQERFYDPGGATKRAVDAIRRVLDLPDA